MKNKKLIIIAILIIMLIPVRTLIKDGGSVQYKAILYNVTRIHALNDESSTGYEDGLKINILGIPVYYVTNINVVTSKIEVIKPAYTEYFGFDKYLEKNNKNIYLTDNISEIYYYYDNNKYRLIDYLKNMCSNVDDGIKQLTDIMSLESTLEDGGSKIYKSREYDITLVNCNTLLGNKDIYIGDYGLIYDNFVMCKR